jgi:hypothetical protein
MFQEKRIDQVAHTGSETSKPSVTVPCDTTGKDAGAQGRRHEAHDEDCPPETSTKTSVYAGLGWLDRLLVVWILLAIIIGIILGNFVDGIGPALQRGKFVDVSIPIGMVPQPPSIFMGANGASGGTTGHDVSHLVQGPVRNPAPHLCPSPDLDSAGL